MENTVASAAPQQAAARSNGKPELGDGGRETIRGLLRLIGEDPDRQGLRATPRRVSQSLAYLTSGYQANLDEVVAGAIFEEPYDQMVLVRDITFYSLCEHHLLPFHGSAHVAYIPDGRIVGLSKLPRIVDVYARRLQVQERLTMEVAAALDQVLHPQGVAVVIEANHLCMMMRGVEKAGNLTVTSSMTGVFRDDSRTRTELMELLRGRR